MMENKEPIIFTVKSGGPIKNMIKIMNQLQKANRPIILKHEQVNPSVSTMIHFNTKWDGITSMQYSKDSELESILKDLPLAKLGETLSFIKPKPLENEPSKYISKPKHNFKKR
ncbi:hypothetical protein D3C85_408230 [compost metagenome]